jgi:hypothetical protein
MKIHSVKIILYCILLMFAVSIVLFFLSRRKYSAVNQHGKSSIARIGEIKSMNNGTRWTRCLRTADGTIYFKDHKMSRDGGLTILDQKRIDVEELNRVPERAFLATDELFYALNGSTEFVSPGIYKGKAWRSDNKLTSLQEEEPIFIIPEGIKPRKDVERWFGIFVYRTILTMPDGSWLMTMYGNFEPDTIVPNDKDAFLETQFMARTIIMTSGDEGHSWKYLSTVAAPLTGEPVGEGFVEPALTLLKDGRLLCIMRAGHHFPLYASWSSDNGKTWTLPVYTGLDRGCDPCLITLSDGRVALSWGRRYSEGWSTISATGDQERFKYPGEGYTNLAISNDGGLTWDNNKVMRQSGSCYSTIFEVEPDVIFMQVDQWYCRITLNKALNDRTKAVL